MVLVCGPAGAGKSTHAARLAADGYLWLSFDRLAWELGHRDHPLPAQSAAAVHSVLRERLVDAVLAGRRVVVDTSFWSRASRDAYRELLAGYGVLPVVHYLRASEATMRARVAGRRGHGPDDVPVPTELMARYLAGFEVPTEAEGPLRVIET